MDESRCSDPQHWSEFLELSWRDGERIIRVRRSRLWLGKPQRQLIWDSGSSWSLNWHPAWDWTRSSECVWQLWAWPLRRGLEVRLWFILGAWPGFLEIHCGGITCSALIQGQRARSCLNLIYKTFLTPLWGVDEGGIEDVGGQKKWRKGELWVVYKI